MLDFKHLPMADGMRREFATRYNFSSMFVKAFSKGRAQLRVEVVIEYPPQFKRQVIQNSFSVVQDIYIVEQLSLPVDEFALKGTRDTHKYLLPRFAISKIEVTA